MDYPNNAALQSNLANQRNYFSRDFFSYEVDFLGLANGASATQQFTIQRDSDFLWTKATYVADLAGAAVTESGKIIPLCTVLIQDTGSGRQLMNAAIPVSNLFGTGELPLILPRQRLFVASSVVTVIVTNFSAATTYNLHLSFIGEKGFF